MEPVNSVSIQPTLGVVRIARRGRGEGRRLVPICYMYVTDIERTGLGMGNQKSHFQFRTFGTGKTRESTTFDLKRLRDHVKAAAVNFFPRRVCTDPEEKNVGLSLLSPNYSLKMHLYDFVSECM